ncbi:solute carrier family 35 member G1-like [Tachypleus tridentatus]|uniref:solute carrier family 35 member G1-like n=1 Tax=Tachypleus tridentatus TaxID=6853 RepID=UPI003FD0EF40
MDRGRPYHGIGLILCGAFFTAIIGVLVHFTKDSIFMDVMGFSQIVRVLIILPLIVFQNVKLIYKRRTTLLISLRCVVGALGDIFLYYSYTLLPLGDATAIYSTNAVFANVFSVFMFKRSCKWRNFVSSILCVFGVVIMCQPSFLFASDKYLPLHYKGIAAIIAASILDSLSYNFNNFLGNVNHIWLTTFLSLNMISLWVLSLISEKRLPVLGFADCSSTNIFISGIGLASVLSLLAITRGFQLVEAGPGCVALSSIIVYGYIFQLFSQDSSIQVASVFGAALIIIAIILSSLNTVHDKKKMSKHVIVDMSQSVRRKDSTRRRTIQEAIYLRELHSLIEKD